MNKPVVKNRPAKKPESGGQEKAASVERTLCIIKPDAMKRGLQDQILHRLETKGFSILARKKFTFSENDVRGFYAAHINKPFFDDLRGFMTSGPSILLLLERKDAIRRLRTVMGATDPAKARPGTLRRQFATSVGRNVVHGSDSKVAAEREIAFFFSEKKPYE